MPPPAPILSLRNIRLTFGGAPLLVDAGLEVREGDRLAFVGRNGSGKSTLMKIAAGLLEPDSGERVLRTGATVRYLPQEPDLSAATNALAYVEAGLGEGDDRYRAAYLLERLGVPADADPRVLSGGEGRRVALARALAPEPDILLLDEPTNHLDLPAIEWLEAELGGLRSAIVTISHDRRFLTNLSRATLWIDRGATRLLDRGFGQFEEWRDRLAEEEEQAAHKLDRLIAREEDWVRYGVTARRKRNMGRMRALDDLRQKRRDARRATGTVAMAASEAGRSGKLVIEAKEISKAFGARTIVESLSLRISRGDRLGIVGPNGAGKTTLLEMLTGRSPPDSGTVRLGANLEIAALDQRRASLDPSTTLVEALTRGGGDNVVVGGQPRHVVSYMKDFLFAPEQARTPLSALSGGERGRLMLARAFAMPSNLLVLDEPTNDLDLETLDVLQEMIADYSGTVILVSHDRDFLDRTVTSVLASEGEGRWTEFAGGYSDMVAQRGVVTGATIRPARAKTAKPAPAGPRPAKQKLSFRDKHALDTLPARFAALEAEAAALRQSLADAGLFARDPDAFAHAAEALAMKEEALAAAEEEWLQLELLRETIEG